jgi:hypothetical protein
VLVVGGAVFAASLMAACGGSSPTQPDSPAPAQNPATATSLTFSTDVQPIINNDCTPCHGAGRQESGYDFRTYAGVMRAVTAGSANSLLVRMTQPGGRMYNEFRGSASTKAETIRRWVVDFNAVQ